MRYPFNNKEKWYNAQKYGTKTSYGYHEGDDWNLRTGGNTDLGQPLFAIADGEITDVCTTHPKTGFGLHLHLKIEGPWGTRWAHYCHLNKIFVKAGDKVKEGQQIAEVGKTGNSESAHLHFAIKNKPTGTEGIAKNLTQLKSWDDPTAFIEKYISQPAPLPKFDVNADLSAEIEADAGLKGYRWYDNHWSFMGLVKFTDALDRENESLRSQLADAQSHKPTPQEALKVLFSFIGGK